MRSTISEIVRRCACLGLVALVLAGCATSYYDQPAARRCDRNGDVDERRAC